MAIEEKENQELTKLQDLIDLVEKDPIPTNIFTIEDTDPLVLLGKLNEIEEYLRGIKSLIVDINSKSMEAVNTALDAIKVAKQALEGSNTALESANTSLETANKAIETANTATDLANDANNTAGDALVEAVDAMQLAQTAMNKAQEALDQVTQGLGTKIYDNHGTLLSTAKFAGHNGINVDMAENDPQTFDIRLDNTITTAIEDTHQQTETNKANIIAVEGRVTNNEADIVELTNMLSATEELAQQAFDTLPNKLDKTGGTMTGQLGFNGYDALPENRDPTYITGITSFAEGGKMQCTNINDLKEIIAGLKLPIYQLGGYDPNTTFDAGVYEISADMGGTNCPAESNYGVLLVLPYRKAKGNTIVDYCSQIYLPNGDITNIPNTLYFRTGLKNAWNNWQSVGLETDFSNAQTYYKFSNGILICHKRSTSGGNTQGLLVSDRFLVPFHTTYYAFIVQPVGDNSYCGFGSGIRSKTVTDINFGIWGQASTDKVKGYEWIAIGEWK